MFDEAQILAGAPLAAHLLKQSGSRESFHMPGNRGGKLFSAHLAAQFFRSDTTELPSTGDLNEPDGVVALAQRQAAKAFGAGHTFFLTGGATEGLQTLLLAYCSRGGRLLCGPGCHRSILFAAALFDIRLSVLPGCNRPVGGAGPKEMRSGAALPVSRGDGCSGLSPLPRLDPAVLEQRLSQLAAADKLPEAVLVTSPDYYGATADIKRLSEICRFYNLPLLVDEAHGAHYIFAEAGWLPEPAIRCGATAVVQSAHKTLPALTPAAMIHLATGLPAEQVGRVATCLRLVRTSSPSLLVAQTIDYARSLMEQQGAESIRRTINFLNEVFASPEAAANFVLSGPPPAAAPAGPDLIAAATEGDSDRLQRRYRLSLPAPGQGGQGAGSGCRHDRLRLVIDTGAIGPAPVLAAGLAAAGIEIELADLRRLVLIISPFSSLAALEQLKATLVDLAQKHTFNPSAQTTLANLDRRLSEAYAQGHEAPRAELLLPPCGRQLEALTPQAAVGRILACSPTPYPPGIPLFLPGDRLTQAAADLLDELEENGLSCQYLSAAPSDQLLVLK